MPMIIAIDGPAGSGKSTVAKLLAASLNIHYLDSGALYRSLALYGMTRLGAVKGKVDKIAVFFTEHPDEPGIRHSSQVQRMFLGNQEITTQIREPEVTAQVRHVADSPEIRMIVNSRIRRLSDHESFVIDGRDIGTKVFPNSPYKFYLDAGAHIRAERRAKEMGLAVQGSEFEKLKAALVERDSIDQNRTIAPLKAAVDASVLDTSSLDASAVCQKILEEVSRRRAATGELAP